MKSRNEVRGPRDYAIQTVRALKQYLEAADIDEARVCEELARIDVVNEELSQLAADQVENLKDQLAIWQASERSQTPSWFCPP